MSKESLESKQKLPVRLQEAICDASSLVVLSSVESPATEHFGACFKKQIENEKLLNNVGKNLQIMQYLLDDMSSLELSIENYVPALLDVQEGLELIERHEYYQESWLHDMLRTE